MSSFINFSDPTPKLPEESLTKFYETLNIVLNQEDKNNALTGCLSLDLGNGNYYNQQSAMMIFKETYCRSDEEYMNALIHNMEKLSEVRDKRVEYSSVLLELYVVHSTDLKNEIRMMQGIEYLKQSVEMDNPIAISEAGDKAKEIISRYDEYNAEGQHRQANDLIERYKSFLDLVKSKKYSPGTASSNPRAAGKGGYGARPLHTGAGR